MKWHITGDTHGRNESRLGHFDRGEDFSQIALIILGDSGINFYLNSSDRNRKKRLNDIGINLYLVRGTMKSVQKIFSTLKWFGMKMLREMFMLSQNSPKLDIS